MEKIYEATNGLFSNFLVFLMRLGVWGSWLVLTDRTLSLMTCGESTLNLPTGLTFNIKRFIIQVIYNDTHCDQPFERNNTETWKRPIISLPMSFCFSVLVVWRETNANILLCDVVWSKERKGKLPCASPLPVWLVVNWRAFQSRLAGGIIISAKKGSRSRHVRGVVGPSAKKNKVALVGGVRECFPEPCVSTSALNLNHEPNL